MGNVEKYIQNYNKEHYKKIYMQIPKEFEEEIVKLKEKYGSYPQLLYAGINAINEVQKLKNEISDFSKKSPISLINWEEKFNNLQREFDNYKNENEKQNFIEEDETYTKISIKYLKIISFFGVGFVCGLLFAFWLVKI